LSSVEFAEGVETVGRLAFGSCSALMNLDMPTSLVIVEEQGFWNCSSLLSVKCGEYIDRIGDSAFGQCTALNKVVIPAKDVIMGKNVFEYCPNLVTYTKGGEVIKLIFTLEDM
jgi:hypothetical protein